ncbi:MAG: S-layer homology domain-containing protein [Magnetococcales bacterium]|nr:S-layer homology domain-containing protein [Magnetococcales bacterium]
MKFIKLQNYRFVAFLLFVGVVISGCETLPKEGAGVMENAIQHYALGMELLEDGKMQQADKKFDMSLGLKSTYAPAMMGKSLIIAHKAVAQEQEAHRKVDEKAALKWLSKADKNSKSDEDRFNYHVSAIRVYTVLQSKHWLKKSTVHYKFAIDADNLNPNGLPFYKNSYSADYYMAIAEYENDFRRAEPLLQKIVGSSSAGKWVKKANKLYEKVQKISRAASYHTLSGVALKIAVLDAVSRGDVAALLVSELELDKLFAGRIRVKSQEKEAEFVPADMLNHPFRQEVATVMKWNIRGLAPIYDETTRANLFKPNLNVNRKELALMLEDVLVRITDQDSIATQNIGHNSPFPDVDKSVAWFNAAMTMTTRGLMKAELSGEFRPDDPVTGADLLLAVVTLRNVIKVH